MADARPAGRRLGFGKKLMFSAVAVAGFFILAEGLLRLWVYYVREEYERYDVTTETWTLLPGVHRAWHGDIYVNEDGFTGPALQADGPDLWRMVAVGDSNTFGGGGIEHTYPIELERIIRTRSADEYRVEVVNAGIEGLDSLHALRRLRSKVLPLGPDVVTIYIGWNDLMKFDPFGSGGSNALSSVSRAVDGLWLVKGMRKLVFLMIRPHLNPPAVGPDSSSGRFKDFVPHIYIANVEDMIREIRAAGARPMIFTLPTVVRPDFTVKDIQEAHVFFPYYASAYSVGDLLDLVSAYNRTIEEIAKEHDVPLVDLAAAFAARADYRKLFYDTMHPTAEGNELIAREIFAVAEREKLLASASLTRSNHSQTH